MVMEAPIRSFFVTLKRGFAGTKESQIRILKSLGFRKREQCLEKENNASIRGALDKVLAPSSSERSPSRCCTLVVCARSRRSFD